MNSPVAVQSMSQPAQAPPVFDDEVSPEPQAAAGATDAMTPAKAKMMAMQCKKAGDTAGALQWMREAKRLENTNASLALPATTAIVERSPAVEDLFTPLEKALNEATATRFQEARTAQQAGKTAEAETKFKEYKNRTEK